MKLNLNLFKKNYKKFILLIFLELLFFILVAIILVFSSAKLAENYEILSSQGEIDTSKFIDATDEDLINLQEKLNLVNTSLDDILKWYTLTLIILFFIYGIFRSIEWLISYNFIQKKKFNFKYLMKFYFLLLIWIIILGGILFIINFVFESPYFLLLLLFLFYVLFNSSIVFLLKENKILDCIKKGLKLFFSKNLVIFLLTIGIFLISIYILSLLANITFLSLFISILSLIWILFFIAWSRIFILLNLKEIY